MTTTPSQLVQAIRDLEELFPIPTPACRITIGVFDAATGKFRGKISTVTYESLADLYPGGFHQPPPRYTGEHKIQQRKKGNRVEIRTTFAPEVDAVHVLLEFEVVNATSGNVVVVVNGVAQSTPVSDGSVIVDVHDAVKVDWKVCAGHKSYENYLEIRRRSVIGVGIFVVPALPTTILYEPPTDSRRKNTAVYSMTKSIGTSIARIESAERSESIPGTVPLKFEALDEGRAILSTAVGLVKSAGFDGTIQQKILKAMKRILDGLGDLEVKVTKGRTSVVEHRQTFRFTSESSFDTDVNDGGPGIGDQIFFLRNARMMWIAKGALPRLILIDWESDAQYSVAVLRNNLDNPTWLAENDLDAGTITALLQLDPFATNSEAEPPSDRFEYVDTYEMGGGDYSHRKEALDWTFTDDTRRASGEFHTRLEKRKRGWLEAFLGVGQEYVKHFTLTLTTVAEEVKTTQSQATLHMYSAPEDQRQLIAVYKDNVFGTFAFRRVSAATQAAVSGQALLPNGKPLVGARVRLNAAGRLFTTTTDAEGRYAFYADTIKPGAASVTLSDKARKEVELTPGVTAKNIVLRLPQ